MTASVVNLWLRLPDPRGPLSTTLDTSVSTQPLDSQSHSKRCLPHTQVFHFSLPSYPCIRGNLVCTAETAREPAEFTSAIFTCHKHKFSLSSNFRESNHPRKLNPLKLNTRNISHSKICTSTIYGRHITNPYICIITDVDGSVTDHLSPYHQQTCP